MMESREIEVIRINRGEAEGTEREERGKGWRYQQSLWKRVMEMREAEDGEER